MEIIGIAKDGLYCDLYEDRQLHIFLPSTSTHDQWRAHNWTRPHGAHGGRPPVERYFERQESTPFNKEVVELYNPALEDYRERNYALDQHIQRLRRSS
jgi:hypothetical protein